MKINFPKIDFQRFGVWAIVAYVLSLPILIWRSSHIGKLISIVVLIAISLWGVGKASDVYFGKFRYRLAVDAKMKPLNAQIKTLEEDIEQSRRDLEKAKRDYARKIDESVQYATADTSAKLDKAIEGIENIQEAVDIIREQERQALKDRIITLREQVKVYKKSVDSAEIRKQCETVADKMFLLTDKERQRFYGDLKDIGFKVSAEREGSAMIYGNVWAYASTGTTISTKGYSSVYFPSASGSSVTIRQFDDGDN